MIDGLQRVCGTAFLLLSVFLAGGMSCVGSSGAADADHIVVTQSVCRAFSTARNRNVDRMRLRKAAWESLVGCCVTNGIQIGEVCGLRVESVNYIGSNKVEAVFSTGR